MIRNHVGVLSLENKHFPDISELGLVVWYIEVGTACRHGISLDMYGNVYCCKDVLLNKRILLVVIPLIFYTESELM